MPMLTLLAGAAGIGAALGLLGGGGTMLTVPLLHALLGVDTTHAVAMSLPVVAVAAAAGAFSAWRRGALAIAPTLVLAAATSSGAFLGALAGRQLSSATQSVLLAATLVAAAAALWRPLVRPGDARRTPWLLAAAGFGVGGVTGVVGVGGGFLIVPALVMLGGYPLQRAVPASLFVIALSASAGALGYAGHVDVPWGTVAVIAAAAVLGVIAGGRVGARLPAAPLQRVFALFLLVNAAYMLATH
jgi:uncharacterized membrane protein YfcA